VALATCAGLVPLVFAGSAFAQTASKPFPTSGNYPHGFLPPAVTAAVVQSSYNNWKAKYLLSDCGAGTYRVENGMGATFSEGQGYGMVLTAYFGDKAQFDGLWSFQQKNLNSAGLMGWHVTCAGFTTNDGGNGSATDGDADIGFGLLVAAVQWGGTYLQTAKTYLATLKRVEFTTCSPTGRNVPSAGDWDTGGGCTHSNTSYWMPGYYRVFQQVTGDAYWGKAADDVVALYNIAADPMTGIMVNEVNQNGVGGAGQTYDYNSCRIPWRAALDYLWFGTPGAQQAMTKLTNWANTVGIGKIVDGYNANGTPTGQYTGLNAWVGGFTAGAMVNSQNLVNTFATNFVAIQDDNGSYYGSSLRTLYLLELSGNQWIPLVSGDAGAGGSSSGGSSGSASSSSSGASSSSSSSSGSSSGGASGSTSGGASSSSAGASGSSGSSGGIGSSSGSSGSAGSAPDGGAGGFSSGAPSGCGCRSAQAPTAQGAAAIALLTLLLGRRRRSTKR
jgi:MYXO-CTERM domain-containing protein